MHKTSLFEMLKSFTPAEVREFRDMVRSPFFNKNENVSSLLEYIRKYYPELNSPRLAKEQAYKALFRGKPYNDGYMRTLTFHLTNLAEDFLAYKNFKEEGHASSLHLAAELERRNLQKQFNKHIKNFKSQLESQGIKDESLFWIRSKIGERTVAMLLRNSKVAPYEIIAEEIDNLIIFFLIRTLKMYCYIKNNTFVLNVDDKLGFLEEITSHLSKRNYDGIPAIPLYMSLLMLITDRDNESHYFSVKKLLQNREREIYHADAENAYVVLQHYCLEKYHTGRPGFLSELMDIYRLMLKKGMFVATRDGYFNHHEFKNIVNFSLKNKEYAWAEKFIEEYKDGLPPDQKDDTYNYSLSRLFFEKGNYEEALNYLAKVKYEVPMANMNIKNLMLRIYYELDMTEQALHLIDSYRHFLGTQLIIPKLHRSLNRQFLKHLKALIKQKESPDKKEIEDLRIDVMQDKTVANRDWLLEKIEELSKQKVHG